jgi:hypothetical protein
LKHSWVDPASAHASGMQANRSQPFESFRSLTACWRAASNCGHLYLALKLHISANCCSTDVINVSIVPGQHGVEADPPGRTGSCQLQGWTTPFQLNQTLSCNISCCGTATSIWCPNIRSVGLGYTTCMVAQPAHLYSAQSTTDRGVSPVSPNVIKDGVTGCQSVTNTHRLWLARAEPCSGGRATGCHPTPIINGTKQHPLTDPIAHCVDNLSLDVTLPRDALSMQAGLVPVSACRALGQCPLDQPTGLEPWHGALTQLPHPLSVATQLPTLL